MHAAHIQHQLKIGVVGDVVETGGHLVHLTVVVAGLILREVAAAQVVAALEKFLDRRQLKFLRPLDGAIIDAACLVGGGGGDGLCLLLDIAVLDCPGVKFLLCHFCHDHRR